MTKKDLIKRWKSKKGQALVREITNAIVHNKPLEKISGLETYQGRWDLRGAILSTLVKEQKIEADGYGFTDKEGSLKLKNCLLESIDFSYCDISYSVITNCSVTNCLFEETKARELVIYASDFLDCIFRKTNCSYSFMNKNIGRNSGAFINTSFINVNLSETSFCFPAIENCGFENCNLMAANFDGSRFKNTKFIGKVDSPWFRGYSINASKSILGIFNRVDPKKYPNTMENVDFSEATLIGVTFSHAIDISKCKFPKDDNLLLIKNVAKVFSTIREEIFAKWVGEDKRIALHMIDNVYYKKDYHNQELSVIDKYILSEQFGEKFAKRLFNLISTYNDLENQR